LRGTAEEKTILNQQKILDQKTQEYKRAQALAQLQIQAAKTYQTQLDSANLEKDRLDYATSLVGQSDAQIAKALELFDVEKEIIKLKKDNPAMTDRDLEAIKAAKIAAINAKELNSKSKIYQTTLDTIQLEQDRIDYASTLVGQADSQVNKAMALYDVEKEMIKLKKDNPSMSDAEIAKIKAGKVALINSQELTNQAKFYQTTMETAQLEKERIDYATTLIGMSDSQVQKAMALYDVEKEMIKIKKENPNMKQEELDNIRAVKVATIESQETNTRASKTFQAGWDKAWSNYKERALDSAAIAQKGFDSMTSSMESALDNFVSTGKLSFSSLAQSIIQDLIKIQLKAQVTGLFSLLTGGAGASGGGLNDMFSGIWGSAPLGEAGTGSGIAGFLSGLGFADGGSPPIGKASLVGERGAELFIPKTAGTIIPNNQLSSMMGNQPQVVYNAPYIANLQTIDSKSFEQRLYQSSGAVWAANAYANKSMATTGGRT